MIGAVALPYRQDSKDRLIPRACKVFVVGLVVASSAHGADGSHADSHGWEIETFLNAEQELQAGDPRQAGRLYFSLVKSILPKTSEQPPNVNEKSEQASGVVAIALWRLLLLSDHFDADSKLDADSIFAVADIMLKSGSPFRELLSEEIKFVGTSLAEFEADIWSCLAVIAWEKTEKDIPRALVYYHAAQYALSTWIMDFEGDLLNTDLEEEENKRVDKLLELYDFPKEMIPTSHARSLWQGQHLVKLRLFTDAISWLADAVESDNQETRTRATLQLGEALWLQGGEQFYKADILNLLDRVLDDENLASQHQQALLIYRSRMEDRTPERNLDRAIKDLKKATSAVDMSDAPRTSKALYMLALRHREKIQDHIVDDETAKSLLKETFGYFKAVREHNDGDNADANRAYYRAALLRYSLGDIEKAIRLLGELRQRTERTTDDGRFYNSASRFWLGRLYLEHGKEWKEKGVRILKGLAEERPFDYYGLRARMHWKIKDGTPAKERVFADEATAKFVQQAYRNKRESGPISGDRHFERLEWSLSETTHYQDSFRRAGDLFRSGSVWYHARDPQYLSSTGTLGPLITWRSLRRDVFSSKTLRESYEARVHLAELLAKAGDWNTSSSVLTYYGTPRGNKKVPGYLAAMYPAAAFNKEIAAAVLGVQKDGRGHGVPPELLYAIIRHESRFSSRAISWAGARGLFQFRPGTFDEFADKHKLLESGGLDREGYLANEVKSIELGALWFAEILEHYEGNVVLAAMEHNAGREAINRWFGIEGAVQTCNSDLELCLESARFEETQRVAREVVVDMVVAKAAGIFPEQGQ